MTDTKLAGIAAAVQEVLKTEEFAVGNVPIFAVPDDRTLTGVEGLICAFEKTLPVPTRRRGTYNAADVASLLAWLGVHAPEAPIFASGLEKLNGQWKAPKLALVAVVNYSKQREADWHDLQARYDFPVSDSWGIWAAAHGTWMKQAVFAEFIEDRIYELSQPQSKETLSEAVTRFLEHTKIEGRAMNWATPSAVVELSRGLKVTSNAKLDTRINLASGEATLNFTEQHQGEGGRPVKVPQMFFIRLPVFFGTEETLIGVRLRYRLDGGSVLWQASMFAPDLIVQERFLAAVATVRAARKTVFMGEPDRPVG